MWFARARLVRRLAFREAVAMIRRISTACPSRCGTELSGDVDSESREFIHRFRFPKGVEDLIPSTHTEVDEVRLITFGPDTSRWFLECPLCRTRIPIPAEEA